MTKLSLANLEAIERRVPAPRYKRPELRPGILHFGVGNFHRAHLGVYLDALFNKGLDKDWAIVGAGVMPADAAMREKLAGQDFLSTIVEQEKERSAARVIGSMTEFVPPGDKAALIARLCDPAIRIVSMTVTEGGYFIDPATGLFDPQNPAIVRDGVRLHRRRSEASQDSRRRAVHDHVLRQRSA